MKKNRIFHLPFASAFRFCRTGRTIFIIALLIALSFVNYAGAATITVTDPAIKPAQQVGGPGCSLVEAIYAANFDNNIAINFTNSIDGDHFIRTNCDPGSGNDTIVLPAGAVFQMGHIIDDAHNYMGPTGTPIIFSNITIEANGATLVHASNNINFRAFSVGNASIEVVPPDASSYTVSGTGNLIIHNAYIKDFTVKGGDGAAGGGGGLGAGGGIYVNGGHLTIENSTFDSNGAVGGNGSTFIALESGGGGGGMGGNGGTPTLPSGDTDASVVGGGGGGGSRGDGGFGEITDISGKGGDGGGTVLLSYANGGAGGGTTICITGGNDGDDGGPGGGGGGGESFRPGTQCLGGGNGGHGGYGGGGGGGGGESGDGADGGTGGGGGASGTQGTIFFSLSGGNGGFGGGGGASPGSTFGGPGSGGPFGGNADSSNGGGGGALGGAIFNDGGIITIENCTFSNNFVTRGVSGGGTADNGADAGGAIFSRNGSLTVLNSTISGNQGTGSGAGIVVFENGDTTFLILDNTIIANNGDKECFFRGSVDTAGAGNLITSNGSGSGFSSCPGVVSNADPKLGPLQLNAPGNTPTMAIDNTSPAFNAGNNAECLKFDQRGVSRPQCGQCDIGAYELECAPQIQISGDVSLPDTCVGGSATATLEVCNTGQEDLKVTSITSSDPQFTVTTPSSGYPVTVSPDFCYPFQVKFAPTSAGPQSSTLTITSNDTKNASVTLTARGNGTVGDIRATGSTDFGNVCAGAQAEKIVSICNVGGCGLNVTGAVFDPACSDFTLINSPFPATVSPDSCLNLTIAFTPTSAGAKSCSLVITSNDPDTPTITLPVTANTPAVSIDVPPDFSFPPTVIQSIGACQSLKSFPVSNTGTCNLTITNIEIGGVNGSDFSFSGLPSFPVILEPGHIVGEGNLKNIFAPTALDRDRLGTITVTYESDPVTHATSTVTRAMCGEGVNTGARVLVTAAGVPLQIVEKIQLQRITGNRNRKILDTKDVVQNVSLQTVTPAAPCPSFQYHREYGTVSNPIQLLPGSYQITATAIVNGKRVSKTVGFSVDTCGFNQTIRINF